MPGEIVSTVALIFKVMSVTDRDCTVQTDILADKVSLFFSIFFSF